MTTIVQNQDVLWVGALAAAPVAVLVAAMCRGVGRPATRHALWVLVLLTFVVPGVLVATGWTQTIGRAVLGVPAALAWAFPPERAGVVPEMDGGPATRGENAGSVDADRSSPGLGPDSRVETRPPSSVGSPVSTVQDASNSPRSAASAGRLGSAGESASRPAPAFPASIVTGRASRTEGVRSLQREALLTGGAGAALLEQVAPSRHRLAAIPPEAIDPIVVNRERKPTRVEPSKAGSEFGRGLTDRLLITLGQAVGLPLGVDRDRAGIAGVEEPGPRQLGVPIESGAAATDDARGPSRDHTRGPMTPPAVLDPIWNGLVSASAAMRAWVSAVAQAAGSISRIPAPPAALWAGGVVLIVALGSARTLAGKAAIKKMQPVDRTDRRLVQDLSEKLGLRHVPRAFVVRARISPMVCGGLNPKIILPDALWRTLDLDARRAVLTHELAHLRRRDQWVRLMELAIGVLYWWHPVLWAVRRRIREEADLCCDAWVTTLFPGLRRSYAEALLRTRCYLSIPGATAPVAGLGMASARSRRFSRRLTMVMTGQTRPKTSPLGLALALAVGTAALVVVPSIAHATLKKPLCPEDNRVTSTSPVASAGAAVASGPREAAVAARYAQGVASLPAVSVASPVGAQGGSCCTTAPTADVATPMATTVSSSELTRFYGSISAATSSDPVAARYVTSTGEVRAYSAPTPGGNGGLEDRVGALEARIDALDASIQRLLLRLEGGASNPFFTTPEPTAAFRSYYSAPQFELAGDEGETAWVEYSMPSDKAEALFEFMKRDDVPIYVSLGDGAISLQGTPGQQRVFAQFLALIHPEGAQEWLGSDPFAGDGRWREMAEFEAARTDMAAERDARAMLERELAAQAGARAEGRAAREMGLVARRDALRSRRAALEAELVARQQQGREMSAQRQGEARRQMQNMERQAQEMERRAQEVERRMTQLHDRAASARTDAQREQLEAQADALEAEAEALREAADELRSEADEVTSELDEAMAEMEEDLSDAHAELEEAMAELEIELAEAFEGEHAENCACTDDCTGEGCEDDCDENCHCRGGTAPAAAVAPLAPLAPIAPAAPARAARPARPAQPAAPAAPASPRPIRD